MGSQCDKPHVPVIMGVQWVGQVVYFMFLLLCVASGSTRLRQGTYLYIYIYIYIHIFTYVDRSGQLKIDFKVVGFIMAEFH